MGLKTRASGLQYGAWLLSHSKNMTIVLFYSIQPINVAVKLSQAYWPELSWFVTKKILGLSFDTLLAIIHSYEDSIHMVVFKDEGS